MFLQPCRSRCRCQFRDGRIMTDAGGNCIQHTMDLALGTVPPTAGGYGPRGKHAPEHRAA